jgi:predicted DCC family thiol-disulfide oxidoreductase YuxK
MAVLLWYGWACLFNRNIFIGNPGLPMVGWLLLACALIPPGEPLSFEQKNPEWKMPSALFWGAWALMAVGYTVSGIHKLGSPSWVNGTAILRLLENPLARDVPWREWILEGPSVFPRLMAYSSLVMEVFFLPLAIFRFTRPWIWLGMVSMHLGILTMVNFADLTTGVLMLHLFTFDPRWIPARSKLKENTELKLILFFDGVCGLCNSVVDFVMVEDRDQRFQFSPLQSAAAAKWLSPDQVKDLDSSVVVDDGKILEKSEAFVRIGQHLGGIWRLFAEVARLVPKTWMNSIYDFVAKNRYRWFGVKSECRMPTKEERARFIL